MTGRNTGLELAQLLEESGLVRASAVVERLPEGPVWSVEPGRGLYPASMIKVPLVAAALTLVARGELDRSTSVAIDARNLTANDGPSPLAAGYVATLDELLSLTITRSDNIATNQLFDLLDRRRASRVARDVLGLRETAFRRKLSGAHPLIRDPEQTGRNTHPAGDAARLMHAIAVDGFPGAARLRAYLEQQEWNTKLSAGLRPGDRFAHKTGDTDEVSHDGGILTTAAGRYVVVVYSASCSSETTDGRFASLMRSLRTALDATA